jgi:hypothetical protein
MVDTWFLMGSPMSMLGIVACYVFFVLKIGPKMMASRKPFKLQTILVGYNISMILLSLYISVTVSRRISLVIKVKRKPMAQNNNVFSVSTNLLSTPKDNSVFGISDYSGSRPTSIQNAIFFFLVRISYLN